MLLPHSPWDLALQATVTKENKSSVIFFRLTHVHLVLQMKIRENVTYT